MSSWAYKFAFYGDKLEKAEKSWACLWEYKLLTRRVIGEINILKEKSYETFRTLDTLAEKRKKNSEFKRVVITTLKKDILLGVVQLLIIPRRGRDLKKPLTDASIDIF